METSIIVMRNRSLKWELRKHFKEYSLKINLKRKNDLKCKIYGISKCLGMF